MALSRRQALAALASGAMLDVARARADPGGSPLGPPRPFSYPWLEAQARALAARPYRPVAPGLIAQLRALDFDAMSEIRFRPQAAMWRGEASPGAVEFLHLGRYASTPVTLHVLAGGLAREILYSPALFDIPSGHPAARLPANIGFAGFRVMNTNAPGDWIAYQGASYFRSAEPFNQYGLSARGLAIDTAAEGPEEFPAFTAFWLERGPEGLVVYALLEGPSVAGAYRLAHRRGPAGLVQDIEARLVFRRPVRRLGLAPLTSMFWYGPDQRGEARDWRPAIHDSDGLSIWTGAGERIWRPLADPPRVVVNSFADRDPHGFGLMQRDRTFADYEDDGAFYDRRPSVWVEPGEAWGQGAVTLVEIPTRSETDDNIVAFWSPQAPPSAGETLTCRYRLHWTDEEPFVAGVGQVVATRQGAAGRPGQPEVAGARKYVIDFAGGRLASLGRSSGVRPVITASQGQPTGAVAYPIVGTPRWRLMFDIAIPAGKTIDLRAFLGQGEAALTETWIGQAFG